MDLVYHGDLICILLSVQALLESMGANASPGPEAVATAERNAAVLTARAGNRDPSALPSICRISAALQYPAGELFHSVVFPNFRFAGNHFLVAFLPEHAL